MRDITNITMRIVASISTLCGVIVVHLIVPQFQEMFSSFGAELPAPTRFFIEGRTFLWILPVAVPTASLLVSAREAGDRRPGIIALILGLVAGFGLPLFCGLAMCLPIFRLGTTV